LRFVRDRKIDGCEEATAKTAASFEVPVVSVEVAPALETSIWNVENDVTAMVRAIHLRHAKEVVHVGSRGAGEIGGAP
jgi:hypothetical protein